MLVEEITKAIRPHQVKVGDWQHAALARDLHCWVEILDAEFRLELASYPVIQFAAPRRAYATYEAARAGVGARDNITFNTRYVSRQMALVLGTLLHELLHLWQHHRGRPGKRNYHNTEYRERALRCGLVVDTGGHNVGYLPAFTDVLTKHGVDPAGLTRAAVLDRDCPAPAAAAETALKMKKWACRCTNVRCATRLLAHCTRCGEEFQPAAPQYVIHHAG